MIPIELEIGPNPSRRVVQQDLLFDNVSWWNV